MHVKASARAARRREGSRQKLALGLWVLLPPNHSAWEAERVFPPGTTSQDHKLAHTVSPPTSLQEPWAFGHTHYSQTSSKCFFWPNRILTTSVDGESWRKTVQDMKETQTSQVCFFLSVKSQRFPKGILHWWYMGSGSFKLIIIIILLLLLAFCRKFWDQWGVFWLSMNCTSRI